MMKELGVTHTCESTPAFTVLGSSTSGVYNWDCEVSAWVLPSLALIASNAVADSRVADTLIFKPTRHMAANEGSLRYMELSSTKALLRIICTVWSAS